MENVIAPKTKITSNTYESVYYYLDLKYPSLNVNLFCLRKCPTLTTEETNNKNNEKMMVMMLL